MPPPTPFTHHLEWPAPGATVAGPVVWLRGWAVARPDLELADVRVRHGDRTHLGVRGLPRPDVAAHLGSARPWLPAEFVVGVPLPDGPATLLLEGRDGGGNWHPLQELGLIVAPAGAVSPRVEGELVTQPGGTVTERGTHLPFHGHLDAPTATGGLVTLFGWVLHEHQAVRRVLATVDGLVFHHVAHGLEDPDLATRVPDRPAARHARFKGEIELPDTLPDPACLRLYAELADGSVALCFARRVRPAPAATGALATRPSDPPRAMASAGLPDFPSGRPRRLLFAVGTLEPAEATFRALDLARAFAGGGRWVARLVAAEDGPLHRAFEDAGCAVQTVDLRARFAAGTPAARTEAETVLARRLWWAHLDAAVLFDETSAWLEPLARARGLAVFADRPEAFPWAAPDATWTHDPTGPLVVPIRGLTVHGAGLLRHALVRLARTAALGDRAVHFPALGETEAEQRFRADLAEDEPGRFLLEPPPAGVAAVISPALGQPPVRALLAAVAAGIPVITTPVPALSPAFGPQEITVVPAGNPPALAHALADTLARPEAARRRAQAARRIAARRPSFAETLTRWSDALATTIAAPR